MQTEIEAKFLDIDHEQMRTKLNELGAICAQPMRIMRRKNYDYPDQRLQKIGGWIRVRDEGDKVTLSYKQLDDRSLHGTKEISVKVDDFDKACQLMESIGLKQKSYQETKRESWQLDGAEIELDEWPWAKPYLEIEAGSEEQMKQVCQKLELNLDMAVHGSVEVVYLAEYDITEDEIDNWPQYKFTDVPEFFAQRRK